MVHKILMFNLFTTATWVYTKKNGCQMPEVNSINAITCVCN